MAGEKMRKLILFFNCTDNEFFCQMPCKEPPAGEIRQAVLFFIVLLKNCKQKIQCIYCLKMMNMI